MDKIQWEVSRIKFNIQDYGYCWDMMWSEDKVLFVSLSFKFKF
jgi:hypothetical protein